MSTHAAYRATGPGPLLVDRATYSSFADESARRSTARFRIPIQSGRAWVVPARHVVRLSTPEGPQVADVNLWNLHNPRERFWASRTRQLHAAHVSVFDRLWSTLPYIRPMATIVADSLSGYGMDDEGGRVHDLLGTRCDPYVNRMLTGEDVDNHCHSNLVRAIGEFGLTERDVHDVINVFQCTGLNDADQYFMKASPARPGDYFELFAEIDLLMALSTCPGGDLSIDMWGDESSDTSGICRPIDVEVFELAADLLQNWQPPAPSAYAGRHGLVYDRA